MCFPGRDTKLIDFWPKNQNILMELLRFVNQHSAEPSKIGHRHRKSNFKRWFPIKIELICKVGIDVGSKFMVAKAYIVPRNRHFLSTFSFLPISNLDTSVLTTWLFCPTRRVVEMLATSASLCDLKCLSR